MSHDVMSYWHTMSQNVILGHNVTSYWHTMSNHNVTQCHTGTQCHKMLHWDTKSHHTETQSHIIMAHSQIILALGVTQCQTTVHSISHYNVIHIKLHPSTGVNVFICAKAKMSFPYLLWWWWCFVCSAGILQIVKIRELHPGTGVLSVTIGSGCRLSRHIWPT